MKFIERRLLAKWEVTALPRIIAIWLGDAAIIEKALNRPITIHTEDGLHVGYGGRIYTCDCKLIPWEYRFANSERALLVAQREAQKSGAYSQ